MYSYDTSSQALADLRTRGFTLDFNLGNDCLECEAIGTQYQPEQFEVKEFYRFEGASDPSDSEIVYGIQSSSGDKGVLLHAFGANADSIPERLRGKLRVR